MRASIFALTLALALPFCASVQARELPDGGVTAGEVADALQAKGFKAQIGKDSQGDPKITSGADGSDFTILFFDCEKGRCQSYQFLAGFDLKAGMTLAEINKWNTDYRYGQAYLDDENDPHIAMDADVEHGATTEALENNIARWEGTLINFKKFIKW